MIFFSIRPNTTHKCTRIRLSSLEYLCKRGVKYAQNACLDTNYAQNVKIDGAQIVDT